MKRLFPVVIIVFSVLSATAQFVYDYLKAADSYFKKGDYYSASVYYEKYLQTGNKKIKKQAYDPYDVQSMSKQAKAAVSSKQQAIYNLAESYRFLHYHEKAEPYYKEACKFDKAVYPQAAYWYGYTLKALGKYEESKQAYTDFIASKKDEDAFVRSAKRELQSLDFIEKQLKKKDLKFYTVVKAPQGILNSEGASYAPVWMNDHVLSFTSTRPDTIAVKNKVYINRIYQAGISSGNVDSVTKMNIAQVKDIHQGVVAFTPDGNTMFFTRWKINNGKKNSIICKVNKKEDGTWTEPLLLDTILNKPGYNTQQPLVMPDGKHILFATDRPGGLGGFDLWSAELDNLNFPVNPVNLGNVINTEMDEEAPYYHVPSSSLVFSSNGRVGMGGMDFFKSKGTLGSWGEPENLGYPVNSVKDDEYMASRGTEKNMLLDVYLSSDRQSPCCLELFSLKKVYPVKKFNGKVVNAENDQPIGGVNVNVTDADGKVLYTQQTDTLGNYAFNLEEASTVKAEGSLTGYVTNSVTVSVPDDYDNDSVNMPVLKLIFITHPPVETPVVLENIYYDFNRATLRKASFPMLDTIVAMMNRNPGMAIEMSSHTDWIGKDKYNQKLSERRAKSCVDYLVKKGIDKARIEAKGYGETMPIAPNRKPNGKDDPVGRQKNRRTEFKVLHY